MINLSSELTLPSGLALAYTCVNARWVQIDNITAVWSQCSMGTKPYQYSEDAFVFQHDTKALRFNFRLPDGSTLADATEIVYRIYNPSTGATIIEKTLTGTDITVLDADSCQLTLDTTETNVTPGWYRHEMRVTSDFGPSTVLIGRFQVADTEIGDA